MHDIVLALRRYFDAVEACTGERPRNFEVPRRMRGAIVRAVRDANPYDTNTAKPDDPALFIDGVRIDVRIL